MLKEALAALSFDVEIGGQTHRTKARPGDLVAFEQHFGRSLIAQNGEVSFGFTDLMFLSWSALKREGVTDLDFDAFANAVDDVDLVESAGKDGTSGSSPSPG